MNNYKSDIGIMTGNSQECHNLHPHTRIAGWITPSAHAPNNIQQRPNCICEPAHHNMKKKSSLF